MPLLYTHVFTVNKISWPRTPLHTPMAVYPPSESLTHNRQKTRENEAHVARHSPSLYLSTHGGPLTTYPAHTPIEQSVAMIMKYAASPPPPLSIQYSVFPETRTSCRRETTRNSPGVYYVGSPHGAPPQSYIFSSTFVADLSANQRIGHESNRSCRSISSCFGYYD